MKKYLDRICAILLAASMLFMTGCMEDLISDSQAGEGTSQTQVFHQAETETTTAATSATETGASGSGAAVDKELGIDYPRPTGDPAIGSDSKDDVVRWLQSALNQAMHAGLAVDGNFENDTESKVKEFQSRCGLKASGQADAETIRQKGNAGSTKGDLNFCDNINHCAIDYHKVCCHTAANYKACRNKTRCNTAADYKARRNTATYYKARCNKPRRYTAANYKACRHAGTDHKAPDKYSDTTAK